MAVMVQVSPAQRRRSLAIAWGLAALVVLFFVVTIVRLDGNVAKRLQQEGEQTRTVVPQQTEANGGQ